MSEEDLERYEAEIELALVQEYRTVLPLFNYVVETERRFYLANEVKVTVRDAHVADLCRARARRRLGVGHVPPGALRPARPGAHLPGRERGAAARPRHLSGRRPGAPLGGARRGRRRRAGTSVPATWSWPATGAAADGRDRPGGCTPARRRGRVLRGEDPALGIAFGSPFEAVTAAKQRACASWPAGGWPAARPGAARATSASASTWPR